MWLISALVWFFVLFKIWCNIKEEALKSYTWFECCLKWDCSIVQRFGCHSCCVWDLCRVYWRRCCGLFCFCSIFQRFSCQSCCDWDLCRRVYWRWCCGLFFSGCWYIAIYRRLFRWTVQLHCLWIISYNTTLENQYNFIIRTQKI